MRNRWEDSKDGGLDEPVTLTERQLRSLERGARAGFFALILALAAGGLAGWSMVQGGKLNLPFMTRNSAEDGAAEAATGTPVTAPNSSASDSAHVAAAAPANQPVPAAPAANQPVAPTAPVSKPATTGRRGAPAVNAVARPSKNAHAAQRSPEPVTESFQTSSPAPASIPTRDPVPVSAETRKPATHDSSAANH
jgi:hypothetical protein